MLSKKLLTAALPAGLLMLGACGAHTTETGKEMAAPMAVSAQPVTQDLNIEKIGEFRTGIFDESATEIVAFDPETQRLFAVNGDNGSIMIIDMADPANPTKINEIDLSKWGSAANSVSVVNGIVAAAVQGETKQDLGNAVFFNTEGFYLNHVQVGALPDMIIITPDGNTALVANEGEPNDAYDNDPEGSISLIDLSAGVGVASVKTLDFTAMNDQPLPNGMRKGSATGTVAETVEPEYIAVSADSKTAWVTLQENNAIAIVDIPAMKLSKVVGLGYKDHMVHAMDVSNKDGGINMQAWPVKGMYQPDSAYSFTVNGKAFVAIANEGDARDYDGYSEETRVGKLKLDGNAFPTANRLQRDENLGRLKTTTANGDVDGDGDHDVIYSYGGRSFAILDAEGKMVFDSGSQFETYVATRFPNVFNSTNDENYSFDDRSDDKGVEPEALTAGVVDGIPYVFIGLERFGGFFAYDVSNPYNPSMVTFRNDRNFSGDPKHDSAGELGPEGMTFVTAETSPNGKPLLIVASEVSGSIAVYEVTHN